ncbi:MAG: selenide, water dikinase SelD [Pseudomonadota bacterium]
MQSNTPVVRDLILVGGGHAHVQVLKSFGMRPQPGVRLTLISEQRNTPYSGMLPGCIAGIYSEDDIHINLDRLSQFASARFIQATVVGLDPEQKLLSLAGRPDLKFDLLSLNSGAVPVQVHADAIMVKPISSFLPKWRRLKSQLGAQDKLLVVGAGAGGVEMAMAMRAVVPRGVSITVAGRQVLPGHPPKLGEMVLKKFNQLGITWHDGEVVCEPTDGRVGLAGQDFPVDRVLWVTGVAAPAWISTSGLAVDDQGFVKVNNYLRSVSHENIFVAGDAASLVGQPRPKSGVYAVRAGPYLADNLRAAALSQPMRSFKAQSNYLALIGAGNQTAFAARGGWSIDAGWLGAGLWWLKDKIDQKFMLNFNNLPRMSNPKSELPPTLQAILPEAEEMRCGGCGAKLAADPLRRVLARLPEQTSPHVTLGVGDDAAQIIHATGSSLLSVDGFRSMISDPYLFGRIVAHHSLNDIYAMLGKPSAGLCFVTVPLMAEDLMEEELYQVLMGVTHVLNEDGAALVGGHSAEGAELSIGLTVTGEPADRVLHKSGCEIDDQLILTKPIGTGAILAGAMRGDASSEAIAAVLDGMNQSNAQVCGVLADYAHALTDITGFGLIGHVSEMLRASEVSVELFLDEVPVYADALVCLERSPSSLQRANELALNDFEILDGISLQDAGLRILADPQTSGGMLAAVAPARVSDCLYALATLGVQAKVIGKINVSGANRIRAAQTQTPIADSG